MPINFTEIESGEDFELLCEDLLLAHGFTIEAKVARGPDQGRDIIVSEKLPSRAGIQETHRYLVECKHFARGGSSVREADIGSPIARMGTHKCDRYILITSTVPSEKVRTQIAAIENSVPTYKGTTWSKVDLTRLLYKYSDVYRRHFPSQAVTVLSPVIDLAEKVENILTVKGFIRESYEDTSSQVQMVFVSKTAHNHKILVICRDGAVEKNDVDKLAQEITEQSLDHGILVAHRRVTPTARSEAAETKVQIFTLDELYRTLIDFSPYVRKLVADYKSSELATYYVDLGCKGEDGSSYRPIDQYIDQWLRDPTHNHISVLGDYGTGKTSFCRQYAAKQGQRWLDNPDRERIPVLINLRDRAAVSSVEDLIVDALLNQYGIRVTYEAFDRYNADGKLLIFFDGFDEMAQRTTPEAIVSNFWELACVVKPQSKVILTCRTHYFRTHLQAEQLFKKSPPESIEPQDQFQLSLFSSSNDYIDLDNRPNFEILHLSLFDDDDIKQVLRKRFSEGWRKRWEQIGRVYNLHNLAQRPVLLDMIITTLPDLLEGQPVGAIELYKAYTNQWLEREQDKGHTALDSKTRRHFAEELAMEMLRKNKMSVHHDDIPALIWPHMEVKDPVVLQHLESDVRTCNFLSRDTKGNYEFVHRSFAEFFIACRLLPDLLNNKATSDEKLIMTDGTAFFLAELSQQCTKMEPASPYLPPDSFVWVPPGEAILGGQNGLEAQIFRVEKGFFAARTPVTNAQYACFVSTTGRTPPSHWRGDEPPKEIMAHPVVNVSWQDAADYAQWIGARLPTEQEWEKVARSFDGRDYPWGEWQDGVCNIKANNIRQTTPVGQYSPDGDSPYGCADMAGNVWEWTSSKWKENDTQHIVRGGAFNLSKGYARCAYRYKLPPSNKSDDVGFRVVRDVDTE